MDILVVEDNEDINKLICVNLESCGYKAYSAYSGTEASRMLNDRNWKLIILDIMIPGKNGKTVLREIKEVRDVPVIMLSGIEDISVLQECYDLGAEDYIVKPFDIHIFKAKVNLVIRRHNVSEKNDGILEFKSLKINTETREVFVYGIKTEQLTECEYKILLTLIQDPKRYIRKEVIFKIYSSDEYLSFENTVNEHIKHIRRKIRISLDGYEFIQTRQNYGYRLANE